MKGEKAFLVVLKNCPAVIYLQHYASMRLVQMWYWAEKYIVPRALCLARYLPAGRSCQAIITFRGSGIAVNVVRGNQYSRPVECSHCKADIQQLDVKRYLQPVGFATDIRYQAHNDVSMPAQLPWKIHVFCTVFGVGFFTRCWARTLPF